MALVSRAVDVHIWKMSLAEIEAELGQLSPKDLRSLALKSSAAFVEKEDRAAHANECSEPRLLAALRRPP